VLNQQFSVTHMEDNDLEIIEEDVPKPIFRHSNTNVPNGSFYFQRVVTQNTMSGIGTSVYENAQFGRVEMDKIVKFLHQVRNACKQEKALDLALLMLDNLKNFLSC